MTAAIFNRNGTDDESGQRAGARVKESIRGEGGEGVTTITRGTERDRDREPIIIMVFSMP